MSLRTPRLLFPAFAALTVALLPTACHPDTRGRSMPLALEPVLSEIAGAVATLDLLELPEIPPGDATEGVHQEQLECADDLRARVDAIESAARLATSFGDRGARGRAETERATLEAHLEAVHEATPETWPAVRDDVARTLRAAPIATRPAFQRVALRHAPFIERESASPAPAPSPPRRAPSP